MFSNLLNEKNDEIEVVLSQAVHRHIPILFRTIGSSSQELLQLIADPPAGSENLLLQVGTYLDP